MFPSSIGFVTATKLGRLVQKYGIKKPYVESACEALPQMKTAEMHTVVDAFEELSWSEQKEAASSKHVYRVGHPVARTLARRYFDPITRGNVGAFVALIGLGVPLPDSRLVLPKAIRREVDLTIGRDETTGRDGEAFYVETVGEDGEEKVQMPISLKGLPERHVLEIEAKAPEEMDISTLIA